MIASRHVVLPAVFLAAISACSTDASTGNSTPRTADLTDPAVVSAQVATLDSAFGAPVTRSYLALAPLMSLAGGLGPGLTAPWSATCAAPAALGAGATRATPLTRGLASAFPDSTLQHVFAWDSASASYRLTSDVSGPPAGVRFLIYRLTDLEIVFPLVSLGHMDLIDVSGAGPFTLHALVSDGAGGGADYTITPTDPPSAYNAVLAGSVTNGPYLALFSATTGLVGSTFTVGASVDAAAEDVHVSVQATRAVADPLDNYYTLHFTLQHAQQTVGVSGTINTFCAVSTTDLTVTVNGVAFAQVSNDEHGLVFTRVDGQPFGAAQTRAVTDLLDLQSSLFQMFPTLVTPTRMLLPP